MLGPVGVYVCFARSGGTLVNRLLGATNDVLVLSEAGPMASVKDPVDQAVEWLGLAQDHEADALRRLPFADLISELARRAAERGAHLVVRDFPTPNFLRRAYGSVPPSGRLEGLDAMAAAGLRVQPLVVARRSASVFASIRRSFPHLADTMVSDFAVAHYEYARAVQALPIIHYEDLTADPATVLPRVCAGVGVPFDPGALQSFATFDRCTGDVGIDASRAAGRTEVVTLPDRIDDAAYVEAADHPLCQAADELLGYPQVSPATSEAHAVPADGSSVVASTAVEAFESVLAATRTDLQDAQQRIDDAAELARRLARDVEAATNRADRLAGELAAAQRQRTALEDDVARLRRAQSALETEVARLQRSWDVTTGELSRAEAIAADRRRQVERLLDQLA